MSIRRVATLIVVLASLVLAAPAPASAGALSAHQRAVLYGIAQDTWRFYAADVDPVTHLPLDNLGPGTVRGEYTSAANVGVYLWAVVAAHDLGLITISGGSARDRNARRGVDTEALRRVPVPVV
jgi:hypothetical protein